MITWSCLGTGKVIRSLWIGVRGAGPGVEAELRTTDGQAGWFGGKYHCGFVNIPPAAKVKALCHEGPRYFYHKKVKQSTSQLVKRSELGPHDGTATANDSVPRDLPILQDRHNAPATSMRLHHPSKRKEKSGAGPDSDPLRQARQSPPHPSSPLHPSAPIHTHPILHLSLPLDPFLGFVLHRPLLLLPRPYLRPSLRLHLPLLASHPSRQEKPSQDFSPPFPGLFPCAGVRLRGGGSDRSRRGGRDGKRGSVYAHPTPSGRSTASWEALTASLGGSRDGERGEDRLDGRRGFGGRPRGERRSSSRSRRRRVPTRNGGVLVLGDCHRGVGFRPHNGRYPRFGSFRGRMLWCCGCCRGHNERRCALPRTTTDLWGDVVRGAEGLED